MVYGYARVSSKGQQREGNSLEEQKKILVDAGAQIIIEECFSGATTHRPKFDELIQQLKSGDTLIVTKMDRFARTLIEGAILVKNLVDREIIVNILNIGEIKKTPTGKMTLHIMLVFAEFERDMIIERTQAGKEIARQNPGYKEGRPFKYSKAQIDHALSLLETHSYTQVENMTGISKSTLLRAKRRAQAKG